MNDQELWMRELLETAEEHPKLTEKQKKILDAAIAVFSEKGYSAASTSEIASKAGVAEGTIFRHYKTKKELLFSIVSPFVVHLIAPFVFKDFYKVLDAPYARYEDFLRAVVDNRMDFVRKRLPILKIMLQEIPFHPELFKPYKGVVMNDVVPKIRSVVERFQQLRGIRDDFPADTVIRLTMTTVLGSLLVRYFLLPDYPWDDEAEKERTIDFLMRGLAGPAAAASDRADESARAGDDAGPPPDVAGP